MCLLIRTHSLPPFNYRIPDRLAGEVEVGSAVITPLSGYSRLGFVVGPAADSGERSTEEIRSVERELSLDPDMIEICQRVSESAAVPLASVLRAALPPGLNASRYRVVNPAPEWRWREGSLVAGSALRGALGREGMQRAEKDGRVRFSPSPPRERVEWAVATGLEPPGRAFRQRALLEELRRRKSGCAVPDLLRATGGTRDTLRRLLRSGAVRVEERDVPPPIYSARGAQDHDTGFSQDAGRAVDAGGSWLWRIPASEQTSAVAALARASISSGDQALVLAPEIEVAERMVRGLLDVLPPGSTVASYHSELGKERAAVYEAARGGAADVIVGTRTAALLPLRRPGVVCVVDEPDEAHRAEPGYEGVPLHARDLALERARIQGVPAVFLSSAPSLRLYARKPDLKELPPRHAVRHPRIKIVDMRGTGAALSPTLLELCRRSTEEGLRTAVIVGRVGYATVVSCSRCGAVRSCPNCDLPFAFHKQTQTFVCNRCGRSEPAGEECASCGARRLVSTGLAAERVREEISSAIDDEVGLLTADLQERAHASVVVGTDRYLLREDWDAIAIPDVDARLLGSGVGAAERAFRLTYNSREAARRELLVQTRFPEHYALRAALRGDYPAFAVAELSKRRSLGYPPYSHVAALTLEGPEDAVRSAVKSRLRPALSPEVEVSEPVPSSDKAGAWRVLLRARELSPVARAGAEAARMLAKKRGPGAVRVRVEVDPEEV